MVTVLDKIKSACEFVAAKQSKGQGPKVTCQVKWVDWSSKWFSPAMCILWHSTMHDSEGMGNFTIPDSSTWIQKVSTYLDVSEDWVVNFVNQCYLKTDNPLKVTMTITFDGLGPDPSMTYNNMRLLNPEINTSSSGSKVGINLMPESQYCIDNFPDIVKPKDSAYISSSSIELAHNKLLSEVLNYYKTLNRI